MKILIQAFTGLVIFSLIVPSHAAEPASRRFEANPVASQAFALRATQAIDFLFNREPKIETILLSPEPFREAITLWHLHAPKLLAESFDSLRNAIKEELRIPGLAVRAQATWLRRETTLNVLADFLSVVLLPMAPYQVVDWGSIYHREFFHVHFKSRFGAYQATVTLRDALPLPPLVKFEFRHLEGEGKGAWLDEVVLGVSLLDEEDDYQVRFALYPHGRSRGRRWPKEFYVTPVFSESLIPESLMSDVRAALLALRDQLLSRWDHRPRPVVLDNGAYPLPEPKLTKQDHELSYLNRHADQMTYLRTRMLPSWIHNRQARGKRSINIAVAGAATGEELARLFHETVTALEEQQEDPEDWVIRIEGFDVDADTVRIGRERLERRQPFLYAPSSTHGDIDSYSAKIINTLNRYPELAQASLSLHKADALDTALLHRFQESDFIVANALFRGSRQDAGPFSDWLMHVDEQIPEASVLFTLSDKGRVPALQRHYYEEMAIKPENRWAVYYLALPYKSYALDMPFRFSETAS